MNSAIRKITGALFVVSGGALVVIAFFLSLIFIVYGAPIFIIGLFILFNKGEESIEQRKDLNKSKSRSKR